MSSDPKSAKVVDIYLEDCQKRRLRVASRPRWWNLPGWVDWYVNTQFVCVGPSVVRVRNARHPLHEAHRDQISARGMLYVWFDLAAMFCAGVWVGLGDAALRVQVLVGLLLLWGLRTNWRLRFCKPRAVEEQVARMVATLAVILPLLAWGYLSQALYLGATALILATWALVGFGQDPSQ